MGVNEMKKNIGYLEGMKCPECGNLEPFDIETSVTITMFDDGSQDIGEYYWDRHYTAEHAFSKMFTCSECCETFPTGSWCIEEVFKVVETGKLEVHKTCENCYAIRQVFFSSGWFYGMLWEDMQMFIDECEGDISVTCITMLPKVAKDKVLDMVEEVWNDLT